jgi:hypothetical protein
MAVPFVVYGVQILEVIHQRMKLLAPVKYQQASDMIFRDDLLNECRTPELIKVLITN